MKVVSLGRPAHFCIPAVKLNSHVYSFRGKTIMTLVHEFLIANYNGYTVRGPFQGTWRPTKKDLPTKEEVVEVKASFLGKERVPKLQRFLAGLCGLMREECMYLECGECAYLIYP